jgi:Spy/CpxP family protein refolding chaperone
MNDPTAPRPERPAPTGRRQPWVIGLMVATAFVAAGLTVSGLSASADETGMHAMMGGPRHSHMEAMAHITAALNAVGATSDQKGKIEEILHNGLKPMMAVHSSMDDLHGDLMRLLTAPTIDRGALEQIRAAEIAKLDQASRTAMQAIGDAAEVLSPDQRAKLSGMMAEHHPAN